MKEAISISEVASLRVIGKVLFSDSFAGPSALARKSQTILSYSGISRDRPSCIRRGKSRTRKKQERGLRFKSDSDVVVAELLQELTIK
jgi:hypothetical protein